MNGFVVVDASLAVRWLVNEVDTEKAFALARSWAQSMIDTSSRSPSQLTASYGPQTGPFTAQPVLRSLASNGSGPFDRGAEARRRRIDHGTLYLASTGRSPTCQPSNQIAPLRVRRGAVGEV